MTWERIALLLIGFIVGAVGTICAALIFNWFQKKPKQVPRPRGIG